MSNKNEIQELKFRTHSLRFEPPDLFVLKAVGDVSAQDMADAAEFYGRAPGKFYLLVDISELGAVNSEARKGIRDVPPALAMVLFGASRQMQIVSSILVRVYMMVNMGKGNAVDTRFVVNEDEARKYVDQLRSAHP